MMLLSLTLKLNNIGHWFMIDTIVISPLLYKTLQRKYSNFSNSTECVSVTFCNSYRDETTTTIFGYVVTKRNRSDQNKAECSLSRFQPHCVAGST